MEFEHKAHRQAYEKVGKLLKDSFGEGFAAVPDVPVYVGLQGSCMVNVIVYPWGSDDAAVNVRSWCVTDLSELSADLMSFLLTENWKFMFGAFSVDPDGDIAFEHTIPAGNLDREELEASVRAVLATADEYDDRIVREWGGATARDKALNAAREAGLAV